MFLLDELYKNNSAYPINGDYIEKFLFYRSKNDGIDVDVCEICIDRYKQTNPLISQSAEKNKQYKSHKKYELHDSGQIYRGETIINCMQLLLQIVNYDNKGSVIKSRDFAEISKGIKESSVLVNNSKMRELLNMFVEKCYSEGNFFAIPYIKRCSLNQAKGRLRQQGYNYMFVDSSDTYFEVCYNYFVNGRINCQLTKLIDANYEVWKNRYLNNWNTFISDNRLQDFMDLNGKPKMLWNKTNEGFSKDLENYLRCAIDVLLSREKKICT